MMLNIQIARWILILALCFGNNFLEGQDGTVNDVLSDSILIENKSLFYCKTQIPEHYNPDSSYTLVIGLHGGGGSYETFSNIWKRFENPQFIFATPQAPYKWMMGDKIGYDWSAWPSKNLLFMTKALELTSIFIENLTHTLTSKYNIKNVYLLGFSQGSIIAQIAGIENHKLLHGIIVLSGPELNHPGKPEIVWPAENTIHSANHLKVFIAHGKEDKIIDIELARSSRSIYSKFGYDVTFIEFEGGHEISSKAMTEVQKWIKKF